MNAASTTYASPLAPTAMMVPVPKRDAAQDDEGLEHAVMMEEWQADSLELRGGLGASISKPPRFFGLGGPSCTA